MPESDNLLEYRLKQLETMLAEVIRKVDEKADQLIDKQSALAISLASTASHMQDIADIRRQAQDWEGRIRRLEINQAVLFVKVGIIGVLAGAIPVMLSLVAQVLSRK